MVNVPSAAVVAVLMAPVFWSVSVTVAPGRTPPLESTTLPVTLPWAKAGAASRTARNARRIDPRVRIGASFIFWIGATSCGESICGSGARVKAAGPWHNAWHGAAVHLHHERPAQGHAAGEGDPAR